MKQIITPLGPLFLASVYAISTTFAEPPAEPRKPNPQRPLTVAVLPFDGNDDAAREKAAGVAPLLTANLSASPGLWLVEREEIDKLLSEKTLSLSGLSDPAGVSSAGRVTGAGILVSGRVIRSGGNQIFVAKIISAETSRVFGETATAASASTLEKPMEELAAKIAKLIDKQQAALMPPVVCREDRMAKLKEILRNTPIPSVRIKVSEQDLSRVTIDPAVETELAKVIKELGGEVVDVSREKEAEVQITGEAISQTGSRRGQLVSARARIELKAIRAKDGKVLATDRETGVAVDISDAVAGKSALQNTAFDLAERIIPALVAK